MKAMPVVTKAGPLAWAGILAATCLTLFLFQKMLWLVVPFLLALILYYALLPWKLRLVLRGLSHDLAASLLGGATLGVTVLFFIFVLPGVLTGLQTWPAQAMRYLDGGLTMLMGLLQDYEGRGALPRHWHVSEALAEQVAEFSEQFARRHLPGLVLGVAAWLPSLLLGPFLAFFMLRDGWRFRKFLARAVPNAFFERSLHLVAEIDRTARQYFIGLLQLTALDTVCLALGLWLIGMDGVWGLGLAAAVMAWVPFVGSVAGCVLVVLVAATDFPGQPGMVYAAIGLFILVRLLDDFVFMPLTVGKSLHLHPLLTVLMIFVGGAVAGVTGLMLVLPVLGIVLVLGETLAQVLSDDRLRARHAHARRLRQRAATADLPD